MNAVLAIAGVVIRELFRRKDFYVLFILTAIITLLAASVNVFDDDRIVRYVKEICLFLIWVSSIVIAVATTARQFPVERETRTIFTLLAKPVSRAQVLWGKFFGCWAAVGLSIAVLYVFFAAVTVWREHIFLFQSQFQAFLLHWLMLAIVVAMALLGSLVFAAPSSNATICFVVVGAILLVARHLNTVALQMSEPGQTLVYGVYFLLPHLELFDVRELVVHDWGAVPWAKFLVAALYSACYSALLVTGAWWRFRRMALQ